MADLIEMDPIDFKHFKLLSKKRSNGKRNVPKDENPTDPFGFARGSLPSQLKEIFVHEGVYECLLR